MNPKIEEIVEKLREIAGDAYFSKCIDEACVLCDTIDLIEQLQQELIDERYRHDRYADFCVAQGEELSKLKEQQRWIPVTEPPKKQERVWIYYKNWAGKWICNVGWRSREAWYHYDDTPGQYGWEMAHEVPTHWMPLPEPPKDE